MAESQPAPLTEVYQDWIASTIDAKGFEIPHGFALDRDGALTVVALAVPPTEAYMHMIAQWKRGAVEMIFGLDRFAKPGQGTTLGDLLGGFHFTRDASPRPFIIEYQFEPRIVKPIEWNNTFWNAGLYSEIVQVLRIANGFTRR